MSHDEFSADRILSLLQELGARLDARGIQGHIYIVGGSAMALAYDRTRLTRDIDGVYLPKQAIFDEAEKMATERDDLDSGWINDAVKGFLTPHEDTGARILATSPGITISVASPERLLAMKIHAARFDRDKDDILTLVGILKIRSIEEALSVATAEYGDQLLPKSRFLTIELLQDDLPMSVNEEGRR